MSDFSELKIEGRVATPGDADWDEVRLAWNLAADLQPSAVAFVESAEDVATTVAFAAANGLRVSRSGDRPRRRPPAPLEDTILIKTEAMRGVEIDAEAGGSRGSRPACSRSSSERPRAPTGSARHAGLLARRRRRRLHARRRPELAGPQARLRLQPGAPRSRSSPPRASSGPSTPRTAPTCSGRCAAVAAATRSSPPCRSSCCRSPRSTPAP